MVTDALEGTAARCTAVPPGGDATVGEPEKPRNIKHWRQPLCADKAVSDGGRAAFVTNGPVFPVREQAASSVFRELSATEASVVGNHFVEFSLRSTRLAVAQTSERLIEPERMA